MLSIFTIAVLTCKVAFRVYVVVRSILFELDGVFWVDESGPDAFRPINYVFASFIVRIWKSYSAIVFVFCINNVGSILR